jgi:ABC-type multidrug transport system ATPase subunit
MTVPAISIRNFSKSFDDNRVVEDLSFEVNKGETFAFLGANGSGKTTTIRCLLGILNPVPVNC